MAIITHQYPNYSPKTHPLPQEVLTAEKLGLGSEHKHQVGYNRYWMKLGSVAPSLRERGRDSAW